MSPRSILTVCSLTALSLTVSLWLLSWPAITTRLVTTVEIGK